MPASFYDRLAPYYHLLYGDWESSVAKQGEALAKLLREAGVAAGEPVLDAASGIGTQTLGLLERGYRVTSSDISPVAIERLQVELLRRSMVPLARNPFLHCSRQARLDSNIGVRSLGVAFAFQAWMSADDLIRGQYD